MTEFEINCLMAMGFGFGSIFWTIVYWIIFSKGKN